MYYCNIKALWCTCTMCMFLKGITSPIWFLPVAINVVINILAKWLSSA